MTMMKPSHPGHGTLWSGVIGFDSQTSELQSACSCRRQQATHKQDLMSPAWPPDVPLEELTENPRSSSSGLLEPPSRKLETASTGQ